MIISFIFAVGTFAIGFYLFVTMFPAGKSYEIASMGDLLVLATVFVMGAIFQPAPSFLRKSIRCGG